MRWDRHLCFWPNLVMFQCDARSSSLSRLPLAPLCFVPIWNAIWAGFLLQQGESCTNMAKAQAAALRLQGALREYLDLPEVATAFPATLEHARSLMESLAATGLSDHLKARGRPLKRVTDQTVVKYRKRCSYLAKRAARLKQQLQEATNPKRHGQILALWSMPQLRIFVSQTIKTLHFSGGASVGLCWWRVVFAMGSKTKCQ